MTKLALAAALAWVAGTTVSGGVVTNFFLLAGQSNMAGRGRLSPDAFVSSERLVVVAPDGSIAEAKEPLHHDRKTAGAGLAMSFARAYADAHPGVVVGLVPTAVGGSNIVSWKPGKGQNYLAMLKLVAAAKARGRVVGILWHQGESNSRSAAQAKAYEAQLRELIAGLRRDVADVPFVAGELGRFLVDNRAKKTGAEEAAERLPFWREINRVTHAVCASTSRCACVSSEGLAPNRDNLHFSTPALREFGRRYYAAWEALAKTGE